MPIKELCAKTNQLPGMFFKEEILVYLVFPLKLGPHLSEFCVGAGGWLDVVHDVNMDVTEDNTVSVASSS